MIIIKKIYIIGGTMGVGKTTICNLMKKELKNSVYLDGDWCWNANPFIVNNETKIMVMNNICYLLNNFIHCNEYDNIIFSWVMHEQKIIDDILNNSDIKECDVKIISLMCDENSLKNRLLKDIANGIRNEEIISRSIKRLSLYEKN